MGRSNPNTHTQNPASRFLEWSGGEGTLTYWNGQERVSVPFSEKKPFKFLVVEKGSQVTGGISLEGEYHGYFSNFVTDLSSQPFTVRSKAGAVATGLWSDIKESVKAKGGKFATSLYIGVKDGDTLDLQNIKFTGAALNVWIDACKGIDIFKGAFAIVGSRKEKNGAVTFHVPVFKYFDDIPAEMDEQAKELDRQFSEYLKSYVQNGTQEKVMAAAASADVPLTPEYTGEPQDFWEPDAKQDDETGDDFKW